MANFNNRLIFKTAFLLALFFSHGIISTEQRLLNKCGSDDNNNIISSGRKILEDEDNNEPIMAGMKSPSGSSVSTLDAFRPLTPDHSHSPPGVPRVLEEIDDFRPTTPGHSPGAGHSAGPSSVGPN